jgi:hypothetical protein
MRVVAAFALLLRALWTRARSRRGHAAGDITATPGRKLGADYPVRLPAHATIIGGGTGPLTSGGPGATGNIWTSNGASADPTFQANASAVTWANDLSTSSNTHQWVSGVSGPSGAGGTVTLGDGTHNLLLLGVNATGAVPPRIDINASLGFTGAGAGSVGGTLRHLGGQGGAGAAGNNSGGVGGPVSIFGGNGGTSTGSANNASGGNAGLTGGAPGTGGGGTAGSYGNVTLGSNGTFAFVTSNAAGPGFGIGTTPGTDPTITRGTGVPATTQTNGSLFLRTDGSSGSNGIYVREGGAWFAIGGGTAATLTFEGQAFQLAAAGSGNGAILWPVGQATPSIGQVILASDVAPANLSISAQSAQPGASTHLTGGSLVLTSGTGATTNGSSGAFQFNIPAPTGSGTMGTLQIQRGASTFATFGPWAGSTSQMAMWLLAPGTAIANGNFALLNDGNTYLNTPSGANLYNCVGAITIMTMQSSGAFFGAAVPSFGGGTQVVGFANVGTVPTSAPTNAILAWANTGSPGSLGLFATGVQFHNLAGAISISQDTPLADTLTTGLTIQGQQAWASATTNIVGASVLIKGGSSTTNGAATAKGGDVTIQGGDSVSGGSPTPGAKVTIRSGNGAAPGDITFVMGGTAIASFSSTPNVATNTSFYWEDNQLSNGGLFTFRGKTNDTFAPNFVSLAGQAAWASATVNTHGGLAGIVGGQGVGGNQPGNVICTGGGPGANDGKVLVIAPAGVGGSSTAGLGWSWTPCAAISLTTGTTTLTATQYACALILLQGTLTGACTIVFPNQPGYYVVDLSAVVFGVNSIAFKAGSTTAAALLTADVTTKRQCYTVITRGANNIVQY